MAAPAQIGTLRATDFPKGIASKGDAEKLFQILNPFLQQAGAVTSKGTALAQNVDGQFATFSITAPAAAGTLATDWAVPTLVNSWVVFSAGVTDVAYKRTADGIVVLRGAVKSGTLNSVITTLPTGFRPSMDWNIAATGGSSGTCQLKVDQAGNVTQVNGGAFDNHFLSVSTAFDAVATASAAGNPPVQIIRLKDGKKPVLVLTWASVKGGAVVPSQLPGWTYLGQGQTGNLLRIDNIPGLVAGTQYTINVFVFF